MSHSSVSFSRRRLVKAAVAAGAASVACHAIGQSFPAKAVTIMVGYAPGGSNDVIARIVAQKLGEVLGQPVLVDNRPGAGTAIASQLVARAPADGHTLLLADNPLSILSAVMAKPPFRPLQDFQTISLLGTAPQFMFVPAAEKRTAAELLAFAKANPGRLAVANPGAGSLAHLVAEMLQRRAGATFNHVAYRGSTPALADTAAGHVDAAFSSFASGKALVDAGRLRPVGVTGERRLLDFPQVPTFEELGFREMKVDTWWGLVGPVGIPASVVARLQGELARIVALPDVREKYAALNITPVSGSPAQFRAILEADVATWIKVAKEAHISLE